MIRSSVSEEDLVAFEFKYSLSDSYLSYSLVEIGMNLEEKCSKLYLVSLELQRCPHFKFQSQLLSHWEFFIGVTCFHI